MTSLLRDARFAVRLLRRNPGFTAVATLTLALGIGATTAIFSVVYGLFFAPLPYRQADRLVMVWEQEAGERRGPPPASYVEWKRQATAFADINAWGGGPVNLATIDQPESVGAGRATPGFLGMLGYGHPLALGRTFNEDEGTIGRDKVVILTYRVWQDRFAGDPAIVGKPVRIDDEPHTVVGVLGEGPADHQQSKIWLPLTFTDEQIRGGNGSLNVMARLKDGVEVAEANARMRALQGTVEQLRATPRPARSVSVEPFRNNFVRDSTKRGIWLLLGAVGFLLLIACANVANLLLTRGTSRRRELAIRTSIGASRAAIARQLIIESLVVAIAGGVLGAVLARVIIDAVVALMPAYTLPSETEITLSVPVLLFAFATCAAAGLLAGLAPAWRASRAEIAEVMKEGGRSVSAGRDRLRRVLIVIEFALALILLAGGGMAVHALVTVMRVDLGFRAEGLVSFDLPVARGKLVTGNQAEAFYRPLLEQAQAVPGAEQVSLSTSIPVEGANFGTGWTLEGRPAERARGGGPVNMVTPEYFAAFGIAMVSGRPFDDRDRAGSLPVAVVNQAFVKQYLPDVDPIGQRVGFPPFALGDRASPAWAGQRPAPVAWQIVGVVRDVANSNPGQPVRPEVTVPFWQMPWARTIVTVRTSAPPATVIRSMADLVRRLDPGLPLANVRTIEETVADATADDRFYTVFLAAFAAVALALAAIGIYGVMSFAVAQRTHEIGLRMALGAKRSQVLGQILREGMSTALLGTAIGGVGAALVGRVLEGAVYGVDATNPLTFAAVAALLLCAALVACLLPARRAASVDPMVALRQD
jgi:putative ABC transport system permease protein